MAMGSYNIIRVEMFGKGNERVRRDCIRALVDTQTSQMT